MKTLFSELDKEAIAIDRIKAFEPKDGYYLAFSGGKDSQVIYHLALKAGVKFDAHYSVTTVDPPELIAFIKKNYPDVHFEIPEINMWDLIVKKRMPPTRMVRYCCEYLKENGGNDRFVVTGVRAKESAKRQRWNLVNNCKKKNKKILNPIIDWIESDVWQFIRENKIKYCKLYDEGFDRLGCIGCPMTTQDKRWFEFRRYPTIMKNYIKAFDKMLVGRKERGLKTEWETGEQVFHWWMSR